MTGSTQKQAKEEKTAVSKIRQPQQKRSIEKKQKIIQACLELVSQQGYHSITTADIAKKAGVSTGIVYSYFKDKKDILLCGLSDYILQMQSPAIEFLANYQPDMDTETVLNRLIDAFIESHRIFDKAHQELAALSSLDPDFTTLFEDFEKKLVSDCAALYTEHVKPLPHLYEKFHIVYHLIETYCHELTLYPRQEVDYYVMRRETISCIKHLLDI